MPKIRTRVSELLGVDLAILQAPMGWIARSQLASAVSNAGGLGIIETSSGGLDAVREFPAWLHNFDGIISNYGYPRGYIVK